MYSARTTEQLINTHSCPHTNTHTHERDDVQMYHKSWRWQCNASVPSLVVIQVSKQHILGDGLCQSCHGLVVLWNHLCRQTKNNHYKRVDCHNNVQVDTWNRPALIQNKPDFKDQLNWVIKEQRPGKLWKEYRTHVSVYFWESPSVQELHSKCHTAPKTSQETWTHS